MRSWQLCRRQLAGEAHLRPFARLFVIIGLTAPLFRPLKHNGKWREERRGMDPDAIDHVVRKYAAALGLDRGYSAHSMRATFITTALENGAQLEDAQKAAGHRDPGTTKLYDRRGYNPEKAASFFCDLLTFWLVRELATMEPLKNLNSSIAIEQRWVYKLFHDYRLLPVISSDARTVAMLSHRPLLTKLIGPILRRANITSLINSLTGVSLLSSSKDGSLLNDAWEIWEKQRDEQKTVNDRISTIYNNTDKDGLAFAGIQKHHSPVRASRKGVEFLGDLYDKIDSIDGKFVIVPGILSNIDKLASVKDANIRSSLSGSGVDWILSDYPYFAMGHEEFRSGVVLLDMDPNILRQIEGDIPFYKEIGWGTPMSVSLDMCDILTRNAMGIRALKCRG
jgi:Phage integrase family